MKLRYEPASARRPKVEMWLTDEVRDWYMGLDHKGRVKAAAVVELFMNEGAAAVGSYVKRLSGKDAADLWEFRLSMGSSVGSRQHRVLFSFFKAVDKLSRAIMLVAGDKTKNWQGWYIDNNQRGAAMFDAFKARLANLPHDALTAESVGARRPESHSGLPKLDLVEVVRWSDVMGSPPKAGKPVIMFSRSGLGR